MWKISSFLLKIVLFRQFPTFFMKWRCASHFTEKLPLKIINFQTEGDHMKFLSDKAFKANVVNLINQSEIVIVSLENYA